MTEGRAASGTDRATWGVGRSAGSISHGSPLTRRRACRRPDRAALRIGNGPALGADPNGAGSGALAGFSPRSGRRACACDAGSRARLDADQLCSARLGPMQRPPPPRSSATWPPPRHPAPTCSRSVSLARAASGACARIASSCRPLARTRDLARVLAHEHASASMPPPTAPQRPGEPDDRVPEHLDRTASPLSRAAPHPASPHK